MKDSPASKRQAPSAASQRPTGGKDEEATAKPHRDTTDDLKRFELFLDSKGLKHEDLPDRLGSTLKEWLKGGMTIDQAITLLSEAVPPQHAVAPQD